jgi:hypothetical protein
MYSTHSRSTLQHSHTKKPKWTLMMMEVNMDPWDLDLPALLHYFERLELVNNLCKKVRQEDNASTKY